MQCPGRTKVSLSPAHEASTRCPGEWGPRSTVSSPSPTPHWRITHSFPWHSPVTYASHHLKYPMPASLQPRHNNICWTGFQMTTQSRPGRRVGRDEPQLIPWGKLHPLQSHGAYAVAAGRAGCSAAQEPTCTSWTCFFKADYFGGGSSGDQTPGLTYTRAMFFDRSTSSPKTDNTLEQFRFIAKLSGRQGVIRLLS